jgi:hypothetical protein
MPNLMTIGFDLSDSDDEKVMEESCINEDKIDTTLDSVTTVKFRTGSLDEIRQWVLYVLPNLKHLVLVSCTFPSADAELAVVLKTKLKSLYMTCFVRMCESNEAYWSGVQDITIRYLVMPKPYPYYIMEILLYFKNFKTLMIRGYLLGDGSEYIPIGGMNELINTLDVFEEMHEVLKNYELKGFSNCCTLHSKNTIQN